jgi:integrase
MSLVEAREQARTLRKMTREGVDPVAERQRAKVVIPTFAAAAEACHEQMQGGWRNAKHAAQWLQTLRTYVVPSIGAVRVDQVDSMMIRDALAPIWLAKPETAKRVHQRIGSVLDFAQSKRWRTADTPIRSVLMGLPRQKRAASHFAAMPFAEVPAFMADLKSRPQTMGRLALQFTILTAARSGEVRGATWAEVHLAAKLWSVPAERMKAGKEHTVPLNNAAIAVLEAVKPLANDLPDAPLFPAPRGGMLSDMTLSKVLRDADIGVTVHGFRSSFRDWAAEETDVANEVIEKALAHTIANKVEAAYRRTDFLAKRRKLMDDWDTYVSGGGGGGQR